MRSAQKSKRREDGQFDLFSLSGGVVAGGARDQEKPIALAHSGSVNVARDTALPHSKPEIKRTRGRETHPREAAVDHRVVSLAELPVYTEGERALVEETLAQLPRDKLWFTYADVTRAFTVSKATVKRRIKAGAIPGIRFQGGRVVEEGAIRRFTREQVRYLLLALRRR